MQPQIQPVQHQYQRSYERGRGLAKLLVIILGSDLSGKRPEYTQLEMWLGGGSIFILDLRYDKNPRHECKKLLPLSAAPERVFPF